LDEARLIVDESAQPSENIIINLDNGPPSNGEPSHAPNPDNGEPSAPNPDNGEPNTANPDDNQLPAENAPVTLALDNDQILTAEEADEMFGVNVPGLTDNNDGDRSEGV
jgi:hypothetical protein